MVSIDVWNASVDFPIFDAKTRSLKKAVLGKVGGKIGTDQKAPIIEALHDITLSLREGDRVGLVGHNGAGKTSLLRMLAGIYEPTSGSLRSSGRITSLLDVTLGMDHEATGYENIMIRGLIMGASKQQMRDLTDSIAEFSGLGDYLTMPVRTYSSGMVLRLAFAIVTSVEADVLLMDEWLSVGDADFVLKAEE